MRRISVLIFTVLIVGACSSSRSPMLLDQTEPRPTNSSIELDHLYIFAPIDTREEDVVQTLREAGLIVDESRNVFPDGVVGRYIYYDNSYLEVLWLLPDNTTDADTRRTAEWQTTGASPFGVGLRRRKDAPDQLPFPSRAYFAEWMRPGTEMRLLTEEEEVLAPELFVVPRYMAWRDAIDTAEWRSQHEAEAARTLDHSLGVKLLTGVRLVTLPASYPRSTEAICGTGVSIESGDEPLMEITFDNGIQGRSKDLRPVLPLVIHY